MKSWQKPTPDQVNEAVSRLIQPVHRRYFFERLENPYWIKPLEKQGWFQSPPQPKHHADEGTISFPSWPELNYLKNVVGEIPKEVAKVLCKIGPIENPTVENQLLEITALLPPILVKDFISKIADWFDQRYKIHSADSIVDLIKGQLSIGAIETAFELLNIAIRFEQSKDENISVLSDWAFKKFLLEDVIKCVPELGVPIINVLCRKLLDAEKIESPKTYKYDENSASWLPDVTNPHDWQRYDTRVVLVEAILEFSKVLIENGASSKDIICEMDRYQGGIFRRLQIFLVSQHLESNYESAISYLFDPIIRDNWGFRAEYLALVREIFPSLANKHRKQFINWIKDGPDLDAYKNNYETWHDSLPDDDAIRDFVDSWRQEKLTWIQKFLDPTLGSDLRELKERRGELSDDELLPGGRGAIWVGGISPKLEADLESLSLEQIAAFLSQWRPEGGYKMPSESGLKSSLRSHIAKFPEKFLKKTFRIYRSWGKLLRCIVLRSAGWIR